MIDFLKLNVSYLKESELLYNPLIKWDKNYSDETGELKYPIKGKYYNLDIKMNPTRKEITGSIHKFRNELKTSQNQNYDDFTFVHVIEMIYHLKEFFNLNLNDTIIENLEIGLNIETGKTPERILNENLIVWNYKTPTKNKDYNGKGKYIEFETSQYNLKIYDKGKQYERQENILRIECKIIRNDFLSKYGIHTLNDLIIRDHLQALHDYLFKTFTLCVIVDNLSPETITEPKEKEIFTKGINPLNWISFQNRTTKKRFKDDFIQVVEKYSLNTIHKEIESKLRFKGKELFKCHEMNDFQNIENQSQNIELLRFEPYIYNQIVTVRKCKVTGIVITHQKGESKFLSQASIMKMYDVDRKTFYELKEKFGPKNSNKMTFDKLCLEIAHNIRNRDSNKRNEIIRKITIYEKSLFPIVEQTVI